MKETTLPDDVVKAAEAALDEIAEEEQENRRVVGEESAKASEEIKGEEPFVEPETESAEQESAEQESAEQESAEQESAEQESAEPEKTAPEKTEPEKTEDPGMLLLAKQYGLSADEISGFENVEQLQKSLGFLDQQMLNRGRQLIADHEKGDSEDKAEGAVPEGGAEVKPEEAGEPQQDTLPAAEAEDDFGKYIGKLEESGYDEEVITPLKSLKKQNDVLMESVETLKGLVQNQQAWSEQLVAAQQAAVEQNELVTFLGGVDSLESPELFGTSAGGTEDQLENVRKLRKATDALRAGLLSIGGDASMTSDVVKRAYAQEFTDHLKKKAQSDVAQRLVSQSRRRMGSGQTAHGSDSTPWDGDPSEDPVIQKWWSETQKENGGR